MDEKLNKLNEVWFKLTSSIDSTEMQLSRLVDKMKELREVLIERLMLERGLTRQEAEKIMREV